MMITTATAAAAAPLEWQRHNNNNIRAYHSATWNLLSYSSSSSSGFLVALRSYFYPDPEEGDCVLLVDAAANHLPSPQEYERKIIPVQFNSKVQMT